MAYFFIPSAKMISLTVIWYFTSIQYFFLLLSMPANNLALEIKCMESERQALLSLKQNLIDRYDFLSSWRTQANHKANDDCCNWRGVGCSNNTGADHHHIVSLDLHNKGLMGEVGSSLTQLLHLTYLDLSYNQFDQILIEDIGSLINLNYLNLSYNKLSGSIPQSLGQLSNLEYLNLQSNLLEGEVSEVHFSKLKNLKALDLSDNLLRLNFNSAWIPPFQMQSISLRNCTLGPDFPKWLQTQNFSVLDISENIISDEIPRWFWNNLSPNLLFLDISFNYIKGEIPNLSLKFKRMPVIILGVNEFEGKIPAFLFGAQNLDLSRNKFSDISSLCEVNDSSPLYLLDTCSNEMSGQLPNCWNHMLNLASLSLAYNYFSGDIPHSLSNLTRLKSLNLRENYFSGKFPSWFNFTDLIIFDAVDNNLSGNLPSWIGSRLPNLVRLLLKSNHFHGNLPSSLCNLRRIEVLDISFNYNISGSIPTCIYNFDVLTKMFNPSTVPDYIRDLVMMWKGKEMLIHGRNLQLQRSIDLSSNRLTGDIPSEITQLVGLISLNLSRNELTGQIPYNMGQLQSLDFLDLSRNNLCGSVPFSLSEMPRLSVLDLSYNNLSGNIPIGTQLQSFPTSSYEGNPCLCGDPLKKCELSINNGFYFENNINENEEADQDKLIIQDLLIAISSGFIIGFWGICGSLLLFKRWRHTCFKFLISITEKVI
ncbi:receptor-like protein EIX2 [Benincasa hispida]|uniref:receptor-like protein EIX2 n=1 Tax=Benincasa hispida TaxID=102211 RepID=UPI0019027B13|nr:receptor-like protein EIX2 [Benincasa hispida]XP_038879000.1 receptor-like protein EIX2 [Benincasa hispida]XP_038879011.1 receptor-like protein EIX2 [Benincasa hispida]